MLARAWGDPTEEAVEVFGLTVPEAEIRLQEAIDEASMALRNDEKPSASGDSRQ